MSDGRVGMENQALGLCEAIARLAPARIVRKHVVWKAGYERLPSFLKWSPLQGLAKGSDRFEAPWPDMLVAVGRGTLAISRGVRKWSAGQTFVVQLQNPHWPAREFDAVVPPRHDKTSRPQRRPGDRLDPPGHAREDRRRVRGLPPGAGDLPRPLVAVLVGGTSKVFDLSEERATRLAAEIALAIETEGGSVLLTFSRRTPEPARDVMTAKLKRLPGRDLGRPGAQPLFRLPARGRLRAGDRGLHQHGHRGRLDRQAGVRAEDGRGEREVPPVPRRAGALDAARPWGGALYSWTYEPIRDTDKAAAAVLRMFRDNVRTRGRGLWRKARMRLRAGM